MSDNEKPPSYYEVGRGRPPKQSQWKKGQSGNPNGRPKKKPAEEIDINKVLNTTVIVKKDGKKSSVTPFEATVRLLAKGAMEGDAVAIRKFIQLCEEYDIIRIPPIIYGGGVFVVPPPDESHEEEKSSKP